MAAPLPVRWYGRGKSELHGAGCWVTPRRGNPKESATENRPPAGETTVSLRARVKRRGKSPPRSRRRERHGKPHPEQGQIGAERRPVSQLRSGRLRRGAGQPASQINGHPFGVYCAGRQNSAYRPACLNYEAVLKSPVRRPLGSLIQLLRVPSRSDG